MPECYGAVCKDGRFWCGAAGSEDCDFACRNNRHIGMTENEIEAAETARMERLEQGTGGGTSE